MARPKQRKQKSRLRTKILIFLLLVSMAAGCAVFINGILKKNCLILENGTFIEVNDAWVEDDVVLYEKNGQLFSLERQEIRQILGGPVRGPKDLMLRIFFHAKKRILDYSDRITATEIPLQIWLKNPSHWAAIVSVLALCVAAFLASKRRQGKNEKTKIPTAGPEHDQEGRRYRLAGISEIEEFFLNMFRLQLGASLKDPSKIERVPGTKSGPEQVYKLHIELKGEWKSRGMTIAPLGEGSTSKSQCFYVIFDTHMVVKIPPNPIRDFSDYIRRIRYEEQIVGKLAPRECIIPNVSVIMSKIHPFPGGHNISADQLEERYITMLEASPEYHKYLMIGGNFAFFMNLSKYYFLSHVMDSLHTTADETSAVITSDAGLILDCHEFEIKYGRQYGWICVELQKLYRRIDTEITKLAKKSDFPVHADERQKKDWLFAHLAWQDISTYQQGLPDHFISEVNTLLQKTTGREVETVTAYRKLAGKYAQSRLFKWNLPKMEGMITNLLVLLSWLGENNVAMRDLKPDNLLVAGDPEKYPEFLLSAEGYAIGLIDLETAVDYRPPKDRRLEQPQLGGTPVYATPSHFFPNEVIEYLYQDIPLILHLQDWYAITAIIYKVVTGGRLFEQTGQKIPVLVQELQKGVAEKKPFLDICKKVSSMFWKYATAEFEMKINENEKWLKSINARFPESMKQLFVNLLLNERQKIDYRIKARIDAEAMFQKGPYRTQLLTSSYAKICRTIEKYTYSEGISGSQWEATQNLLEILEDVARLRKRWEYLSGLIRQGSEPLLSMTAKDLLEQMFDIVFSAMYPEDWGPLSELDSQIEGTGEIPSAEDDDQGGVSVGYTATVEFGS